MTLIEITLDKLIKIAQLARESSVPHTTAYYIEKIDSLSEILNDINRYRESGECACITDIEFI